MNIITRAIHAWMNWRDRRRLKADDDRLRKLYPKYREYQDQLSSARKSHRKTRAVMSELKRIKTDMLKVGTNAQGR